MSTVSILLLLIGAVVFIAISTYNGLVAKRIRCDNTLSQVDVQLKRRHDLIPNLVETVKGYAGHEKETLERVIQARNAAVSAGNSPSVEQRAMAESALGGALRQLFALSESYPDLKANQNFLELQSELSSTEDRISSARQLYNESVGTFNTAIEQFPGNFFAGNPKFKTRSFFELEAAEAAAVKAAPKVAF